jgi:hypothetical protein
LGQLAAHLGIGTIRSAVDVLIDEGDRNGRARRKR